jgi:hypothetical protein
MAKQLQRKAYQQAENTIEKIDSKPSSRAGNMIPILVLMLLSMLLYISTITFDYALDDKIVIQDNQFVKKGTAGIGDIMSKETFTGYFGEQKDLVEGARYRPLSLVTFAMEHQLFKTNMRNEKGQTLSDSVTKKLLYVGNPHISHFINVLLYAFCAFLLFRVLSMMFPVGADEKWYFTLPFVTTLLFVVHPIHIEVVANIKGRDEIMVFLFSFATLLACLRYAKSNSIFQLVLAAVYLFLGLLSKENAITFLAVIPVALYFFTEMSLPKIGRTMLPLLLVTCLFLLLRYSVIGYFMSSGKEITDIMNNPFFGMNFSERTATVFFTLGKYIMLLFFPHPLTHDYYPYQIPKMQWNNLWCILSLITYIGLAIFSVWSLFRKSIPGFTAIFYLATLSIVSYLPFSIGTFMNDRFVFISSFAFCLFLAWLLVKKLPEWIQSGSIANIPIMSAVILGILSLGFVFKTLERTPVWKNGDTLNEASIKISTGSARANMFMGTTIFEKRKLEKDTAKRREMIYEAERYVKRALEIYPDYGSALHMQSGIAGEVYDTDHDLDKLLLTFKQALAQRDKLQLVDAKTKNTFADSYLEYLISKPAVQPKVLSFLKEIYPTFLEKKERTNALRYINYALIIAPQDPDLLAAKATATTLSEK